MREITAETAADYLRETGRVPEGREVAARALGGGVSNVVLRVEVEGQAPIVLKQSRERLRTKADWVSRLDRIWTEQAALERLAGLLPPGRSRVLFEDRENYLFAMTCARTTRSSGRRGCWPARPTRRRRRAGDVLGTIHAETAGHPDLAATLADTVVFDQLRIDPYYRTVAQVHPDLAPPSRP